jgi:hypothetical protein
MAAEVIQPLPVVKADCASLSSAELKALLERASGAAQRAATSLVIAQSWVGPNYHADDDRDLW